MSRHTPALAAYGVAALLVAVIGWRLWAGYERLAQPLVEPAPAVATVAPTRPRDERRLAALAEWHLFGSTARAPVPKPEPEPVAAPATRLDLTLHGVLASDDAVDARAIISAPGNPERQYRLGDELPAGAELAGIRKDHVLLKRNGRYETLALARDEGGESPAAATSRRRPGSPALPPALRRRDPAGPF